MSRAALDAARIYERDRKVSEIVVLGLSVAISADEAFRRIAHLYSPTLVPGRDTEPADGIEEKAPF